MCPFSDTLRVYEIGYPQGGMIVSFFRNSLMQIRSPIPGLASGAILVYPFGISWISIILFDHNLLTTL
jgi:hypothetical protein